MSTRLLIVYFLLPFLTVGILKRPFWGILLMGLYYAIRPDIWGAPDFLRPAFIFTSATLLSLFLHRDEEDAPILSVPLIIFVTLGIWMLFISQFALFSPSISKDFATRYLKLCIQLLLAACLITSVKRVNIFLWITVLGMLWLTKSVIFQYLGGAVRVDPRGGGGGGGNAMATILVMTLPFLYHKLIQGTSTEKKLALACIPLWVFDMVAIASRGAFLAFLFATALFFLGYHKKKKLLLVIVPSFILLASLGTTYFWDRMATVDDYSEDRSAAKRVEMWQVAIRYAKHNLFTGIGVKNFGFISERELGFTGETGSGLVVHNALIELLVETGLPGMTLYLMGAMITLFYLRKCKASARAKGDEEGASLAFCLQIAIFVFLFRGLTGSNEYDDFYYYIIGASMGLHHWMHNAANGPGVLMASTSANADDLNRGGCIFACKDSDSASA